MIAQAGLWFLIGSAWAAPPADHLARATREHLEALVRLDTTNPPGSEILAARYLKKQLERGGIPAKILTWKGTRSGLVSRIKGTGAQRPLLLMCHTDVVAAERGEWSSDPFKPLEKDGYLYGRGTADNKELCAAELSIMLWLKRSGTALDRDVIFFAEADEEAGEPVRYIDWFLKEHRALIDAEFALNEGGNTLWEDGKVTEIRVETAEKAYADLTLRAHGRAGHASVPRSDNTILAVARAVTRATEYRGPARLDPVTAEFFSRQKETAGPELRAALDEVLQADPGEGLDRAADRLSSVSPEFGAMLRDTVTPTAIKGGYKSNVAPALASATLNARLLPRSLVSDFVAGLEEAIENPEIEILYDKTPRPAAIDVSTDTVFYKAIEGKAQSRVMAFMADWSTDSQPLRALGIKVYGIDPPLGDEDGRRVHGKDERIALAALDWYVNFLKEIVLGVAGKTTKP